MIETLSLVAGGVVVGLIIAELRQSHEGPQSDDVLDGLCAALEDPDRQWRASYYTLDCPALKMSVWLENGPQLYKPQRVKFSRAGRRRLRASMKVAAENAIAASAEEQDQRERLDQ